jgi:hypothetical protein
MLRVKFHTNWCSDERILGHFNRCTPLGDYCWKNMQLVLSDDYDFFIIFNHPQHLNFKPQQTLVFECETKTTRLHWRRMGLPYSSKDYFYICRTEYFHTLDKWYLGLKWSELNDSSKFDKHNVLSGIASDNYTLPGHKRRLNFSRYLDNLPYYHHFGRGQLGFLKSFRGELRAKEDGLHSYRYHFNSENEREINYFTEKIIDPILCESLCFYDGCPNLNQFIDPNTFIRIDLDNPTRSLETIIENIENKTWESRLGVIRNMKNKLMNELNPLNIIWKLITKSTCDLPEFRA